MVYNNDGVTPVPILSLLLRGFNMTHRSQTLSAILITYNNALTLDACLASLTWVEELLVVDLGSTDETLTILKDYKARLYFHPSADPYVLQQFLLDNATKDWVLWVDPDDVVPEMLRHEIDGALMNPSSVNGFTLITEVQWQNQPLECAHIETAGIRLLRRKIAQPVDAMGRGGLMVHSPIGHLQQPIIKQLPNGVEPALAWLSQQATETAVRSLLHSDLPAPLPKPIDMVIAPLSAFFADAIFQGNGFKGAEGIERSWLKGYAALMQAQKQNQLAQQSKQLLA